MDNTLYLVEGQPDTDLEGMVFAVCTTRDSADKALKMSFDGRDVQITEVIADIVKIDDEVISTKEDASVEDRKEELLISAFEWAINVSEQATHDLIRATGITSEELSEIGYDKENFPQMHEWVEEA